MAMVCIKVPADISKLLSKIEVDGVKESVEEIHITLLYMEDDLDIKTIQKCTKAISVALEKTKPFSIEIDEVSSFPGGKDGIPIIVPIKSKELQTIWKNLKIEFDKEKIDYSKKWKEFKPHITLSYSDTSEKKKITPVSFTVSDILLWSGAHGEEKINVNFPLHIESNYKFYQLLKYAEKFNQRLLLSNFQP